MAVHGRDGQGPPPPRRGGASLCSVETREGKECLFCFHMVRGQSVRLVASSRAGTNCALPPLKTVLVSCAQAGVPPLTKTVLFSSSPCSPPLSLPPPPSSGRRLAPIQASIKMDGILMKKTDNRVTGAVTMKKRYFCLTNSSLAYYEVGLCCGCRLPLSPTTR